ncbi:hypothetical protein PV10_01260 [Exophiala mesophila]|uniref:Uncharacterized protein n=1 Tax=Exophiala mesophila TaxID=212818 RepID=A0A0D2AF53_EXOME|nr:uncharacterized protein PV10_01260 [Exophiala mesophila]KIV97513.1 hypothetical protein PV10_01260 [Exophiala mesophila]
MLDTRQEDAAERKQSIALSARYPRVAVALGVPPRWHIPLMLCRSLSTISALWWACQMCISLYRVFIQKHGLHEGARRNRFSNSAPSQVNWAIAVAQIGLSFLWAGAAAYLAHLFASSLMSRWLLHYSPFAVLVRLCSMSILLSFGCMQVFRVSAATEPELFKLSRSLLAWIIISIALMLAYFSTQQDISVEHDRDDRRRRQLLRLKCFYSNKPGCGCNDGLLGGEMNYDVLPTRIEENYTRYYMHQPFLKVSESNEIGALTVVLVIVNRAVIKVIPGFFENEYARGYFIDGRTPSFRFRQATA